MKQKLQRYAELKSKLEKIQDEIAEIQNELKANLGNDEEIAAHGFRAYWKAGRKATNHEQAVLDAKVSQEVIDNYSTTKITVKWASITKRQEIDTSAYTVVSDPQFVITVA